MDLAQASDIIPGHCLAGIKASAGRNTGEALWGTDDEGASHALCKRHRCAPGTESWIHKRGPQQERGTGMMPGDSWDHQHHIWEWGWVTALALILLLKFFLLFFPFFFPSARDSPERRAGARTAQEQPESHGKQPGTIKNTAEERGSSKMPRGHSDWEESTVTQSTRGAEKDNTRG